MRGTGTNRKKLARALCAIGIGASDLKRSVIFGPCNEILLEDGRAAPTIVEYGVSWYAENIKGDTAEEVARRVKEILDDGYKDGLRELRMQFMKLRDHITGVGLSGRPEGIKPDQAFIDKIEFKIKERVDKLKNTSVAYKVNYLLDYYHDCYRLPFILGPKETEV